ncbi:lasso peptide biosynthesis B2 protein [Streptomyces sp. NPDC001750]|uniref:lasso peptide biosynthesis B2 protein n=1 Tax=Streptomyces sp. NPDC001750 TaxID=3364607 RepID=UPI00368B2F3C
MSFPVALPPRIKLSPWQYVLARADGMTARWVTANTPRLNRALAVIQQGAGRLSTAAETEHAVLAVCTADLRLGGTRACLPRSVAALLYCRAQGHTPSLVIGIQPGTAQVHAWLEADGRPAGEPNDPTRIYTPIIRYNPQEK